MTSALLAIPATRRSIDGPDAVTRAPNPAGRSTAGAASGTGVMVGTVTSVTTGRPIHGARLTLDGRR
jgi:hypothetical protein